MLQAYNSSQHGFREEPSRGLDAGHYLGVVKRRFLWLIVPSVLILIVGSFLVVIQRSIYSAEGKILVESQEIPTDLVRPTVTTAAVERVQVIEQRMLTRDNLLAIINKYGLFPSERKWMSATAASRPHEGARADQNRGP